MNAKEARIISEENSYGDNVINQIMANIKEATEQGFTETTIQRRLPMTQKTIDYLEKEGFEVKCQLANEKVSKKDYFSQVTAITISW